LASPIVYNTVFNFKSVQKFDFFTCSFQETNRNDFFKPVIFFKILTREKDLSLTFLNQMLTTLPFEKAAKIVLQNFQTKKQGILEHIQAFY